MKTSNTYKVVVVDDEKKAVERFKRIIGQEEAVDLVAGFTNPNEAINYIKTHEVDIAFVDIEMPEIGGLELADMIAEVNPMIDVVFVTAYSQYALQAFQVHAVGYLLKPIEIEDIRKQMGNIKNRREVKVSTDNRKKFTIQCMSHFLCYYDEQQFINWRTAKSEELLGFLVHHRGRPVAKEKILDTLWHDMDPKKASQNLSSNLHYVRDVLKNCGADGALERNRNNYRLNTDYIECDMIHFMALIEAINDAGVQVHISLLEKADQFYQGAYFDNKTYAWADSLRLWLQSQYERIKLKQTAFYKASGEIQKAIDGYHAIIHLNPTLEDAYMELAEIYLNQNAVATAVKCYKLCEKVLKDELDVDTSVRFQALMATYNNRK